MAWGELVALLIGVFAAGLGGSVVGDLLRRNLDVHVAHVRDVQTAARALVEYSSLVAKRRATEDESLDHQLRRASDALESAIAMVRVGGPDLGRLARDYIALSEEFAAKSPEVSEYAERTQFRRLLQELRTARLAKVRKR